MSSAYLLIFIEAGTKYVYVFIFYVVLSYHLFRFSVFYNSGIGGRLPADGSTGSLYIRHGHLPVTSSVLPCQRCGIFII